ncbi:signal peptidase I [Actinomadura sp. BRA 177]|uniref:signal peptidase I n=1 Tax=Actinomadura sp. BRA 177 TaxID=2745202 RepID=UPI0015950692|nr:signal peptidase I [Actinomadura sp. BRA 177]NVI87171.1 signal peptidase I [Actinomadura sp. BRA 177]
MAETIYTGNAAVDAGDRRGWLIGHFLPGEDARHSDDVEIKWAVHPQGERRSEWVADEQRTAVLILISGRFRVELPGRDVLLADQGDYVVFHGISHSWEAEQDSVVLAVRWPSLPSYQYPTTSP